jgi:hypothetical protein
MVKLIGGLLMLIALLGSFPSAALAEPENASTDPALPQDSPVLQRWRQQVPDVLSEIRHDPSFRTRLRVGYSQFLENSQSGLNLGVEDVFLGRTGLTVSGSYQGSFDGDRSTYGGDLQYYVLPLGSTVNIAPVVGYRHVDTGTQTTDGVNVGARVRFVPSRTAAADITFTQSWVAPGSNEEVTISTLSLGYAVTHDLRISTDLERQNAPSLKDSRVAIVVEWMPFK